MFESDFKQGNPENYTERMNIAVQCCAWPSMCERLADKIRKQGKKKSIAIEGVRYGENRYKSDVPSRFGLSHSNKIVSDVI